MKTYILVMRKAGSEYFIKIGRTKNFIKRMRIYSLHNPLIDNYILFNGDFESELLWQYRDNRIENTEWICIDYNIIPEVIENFNLTELEAEGKTYEAKKV